MPGAFAGLFPETTDQDLAAALLDGLYRAKLDGWLPGIEGDTTTFTVTPAISMTAMALIVVYAGINFVRNEIKNMDAVFKAESAGNSFQREKSSSAMTERLKEMQAERDQLLALARRPSARPVYMHDGYAIRLGTLYPVERLSRVPYQQVPAIELT